TPMKGLWSPSRLHTNGMRSLREGVVVGLKRRQLRRGAIIASATVSREPCAYMLGRILGWGEHLGVCLSDTPQRIGRLLPTCRGAIETISRATCSGGAHTERSENHAWTLAAWLALAALLPSCTFGVGRSSDILKPDPSPMIRVLIVDDHPLMRRGL